MAIQRFDELNRPLKEYAEIWFDKMDIPKGDKERRSRLAFDFCEIIIMLFEMIDEGESRDNLIRFSDERLNIIADNYIGQEDIAYVNDWSKNEAEKIVEKTLEKVNEERPALEPQTATDENGNTYTYKPQPKEITFEEFGVSIPESEYWTSDLRGILLGVECATCISNYYELYDALERGYTRKVWKSEGDERVRDTHVVADGQDIPITDLFLVGESYLLFPGDVSNGAEEKELANCRCIAEYY